VTQTVSVQAGQQNGMQGGFQIGLSGGPSGAPGAPGSFTTKSGETFRDTPRILARHRNVLTVLIVLWALTSIATLGSVRSSMAKARRASAQVELVQQTKIRLTRADSLATSGFLSGGLQSDQALAAFATDIREANVGLGQIQQGTEGQKTKESVRAISEYLTDVTAAQANNRQGFPVGATYQKTASKLLAEQVVGPLDSTELSSRLSLDSGGSQFWMYRILSSIFILLMLVPLVLALLSLKGHSNRTINTPVVAGLIVALLGYLFASSLSRSAVTNGFDNIKGPLHQRDLINQARVALYDAKSNEALTLIARGSGQSYEQKWRVSMATLNAALAGVSGVDRSSVDGYEQVHTQIRKLDDAGDWDTARAQVLPPRADRLSSGQFERLDLSLESLMERQKMSNKFDVGPIALAQVILALAAALAAWLVRLGYAQRLKEYQ
jgi:hypothetical protein